MSVNDINITLDTYIILQQGNTDKVSKLLSILETRTNAFEHLVDSLEETKQSEALKTLTDHPNGKELMETRRNEAVQRKADSLVGDEGNLCRVT